MTGLVLALLLDANAAARGLEPAQVGLFRTIAPLGGELNGLAFSADGRRLAVGCGQGARVYETASWRQVARLEGHPNHVQSVALSPDGAVLAAGGAEGTVLLWGIPDGRVLQTFAFHAADVYALAFSPDGATLVSGGEDGRLRAWETATGRTRATLPGKRGAVWAATFSPDGGRLAVGGLGATRVYRTEGWVEERALPVTGDQTLSFSADGRRVAGFGPGGMRAWEVATGTELRAAGASVAGTTAGRLTPDGRLVVAAQGPQVLLWEAGREGTPARLDHHTAPVTAVAVHPRGRSLASIGQDRHLKIWGRVPGGMERVRGKGFLGVTVQDTAGGRVLVSTVYAGSAAESAGIRSGDLLIRVAGQLLETMTQAVDQIGSFQEGDELEFEIERGGEAKSMKVKLGKRPAEMPK